MNSQQLLFINFIIFAALVLFFIFGRSKDKQKPILDLKKSDSENIVKIEPVEVKTELIIQKNFEPVEEVKKIDVVVAKTDVEITSQVSVNKTEVVYFVYNGHEWEAHEVLGLEPGISLDLATIHYQKLIKTSDPSTFEFYEAAFSAIIKLNRADW